MPSVRERHGSDAACRMRELIRSGVVKSDVQSFYVADLRVVARRYRTFRAYLPRIRVFYAVKCNADPAVLDLLASLGAGFDVASGRELRLVEDALPASVMDSRVIFANPVKNVLDLRNAVQCGVSLMTFDSAEELRKIAQHAPHAQLLLRIAVDDTKSRVPLASKFGALACETRPLLIEAKELGACVVGVAFHVGSGCTSVDAYVNALAQARRVFDEAEALGLAHMSVLDIGGGFPGVDGEVDLSFVQIATTLRSHIDSLFQSDVEVIAEPGRYIVCAAFALATKVCGARQRGAVFDYFIADGVYGSFKDAVLLDFRFRVEPLLLSGDSAERRCHAVSNVYGPTHDAHDVVLRNAQLPRFRMGDWLFFPNMGAYTVSLATELALMPRPTVHYLRSKNHRNK